MRLPFSFLLVWRPTNYLHPRLSPDRCSLSIQTSFFAVPPQKPTVHDEKGRRLLSKLGPYKVGDEAVVTCKTTGGENNQGRTPSLVHAEKDKIPCTTTAVSSEAWAKLREWAILAGKGRLLLSGSVVLASLKAAVVDSYSCGTSA